MARFDKVALLLLSITIWFPMVHCSKKAVGVARKEDIPYIRCQVCEKLAYQLYHQVQEKQADISPKKISEYQIIEISENVCNLKKQEADWILKIDIVEQGDKLENRVPGEPFVAKSSKEAEMEKLMRSMQNMPGAPGMQMYSREDLMNQKFGDEDADDDEDDDEGGFPSKLGKVIKEKESKNIDWKQRIRKGIQDTSEILKNHANRISHRMRKWWGAKKAQWKKSSKNGKGEL